VAKLTLPGGERLDIPRHLWFPSAMTVVALFAGGLYLGKVIGDAPDAGAAFITTLTLRGQVIKVAGKPVRVLVPAKTIVKNGVVITVPGRAINLTKTIEASVVSTVNNTTTVRQTISVPVTVTSTATDPGSTVTETATVTYTVTDTGTGTTTVSSSITTPGS
jgi:hypothetical protein